MVGLFVIVVALTVCGARAEAQQPTKVPRIGFLGATSPSAISARLDAFRQGLRELGYVEGKNILIEYRYAEAKLDRLPAFAADRSYEFRRAALYVDKILKGAKPAHLPVEQPKKFELIINLKVAKQIGISRSPLERAGEGRSHNSMIVEFRMRGEAMKIIFRFVAILLAALVMCEAIAQAQQPKKAIADRYSFQQLPRFRVSSGVFQQYLREQGYVEGNILLERLFAGR